MTGTAKFKMLIRSSIVIISLVSGIQSSSPIQEFQGNSTVNQPKMSSLLMVRNNGEVLVEGQRNGGAQDGLVKNAGISTQVSLHNNPSQLLTQYVLRRKRMACGGGMTLGPPCCCYGIPKTLFPMTTTTKPTEPPPAAAAPPVPPVASRERYDRLDQAKAIRMRANALKFFNNVALAQASLAFKDAASTDVPASTTPNTTTTSSGQDKQKEKGKGQSRTEQRQASDEDRRRRRRRSRKGADKIWRNPPRHQDRNVEEDDYAEDRDGLEDKEDDDQDEEPLRKKGGRRRRGRGGKARNSRIGKRGRKAADREQRQRHQGREDSGENDDDDYKN